MVKKLQDARRSPIRRQGDPSLGGSRLRRKRGKPCAGRDQYGDAFGCRADARHYLATAVIASVAAALALALTLLAEGKPFAEALREASIGRVRPKIMTAATAILGLLPLLVLRLHGTEIERPLVVVMIGGLVTSTLFTLLALPTFYMLVHQLQERLARCRADHALPLAHR